MLNYYNIIMLLKISLVHLFCTCIVFKAAVNPGYSSSTEVTADFASPKKHYTSLKKPGTSTSTHHYKSIKKPNQDCESGEYTNPETYTVPPVLPERNYEEEDEDGDYVAPNTPTDVDIIREDLTFDPVYPLDGENLQTSGYLTLEPQSPPPWWGGPWRIWE